MLVAFVPLILASVILATPVARESTRQYTVYNKCPTPIDLYIAGSKQGTIPKDGSITKTLGTGAGYFFTNANGGSQNGAGTIRAGFHDDYYYMISDPDHVNTGLRVKPKDRSQPYKNSFCQEIQCDGRGCPQAFSKPPTTFPAPTPTAPSPPYYRCPIANPDYEITFCPTGEFADQGQPIHFNHLKDKCLGVRGGVFANGTPVQVYDCIGTQAQRWIVKKRSTKVQIAGTNFCLDAGEKTPENGVQLKIWQCHDNIPAQQWFYTIDNHIVLENSGICVDLENGDTATGSKAKVQTWKCSSDNHNQVWTL